MSANVYFAGCFKLKPDASFFPGAAGAFFDFLASPLTTSSAFKILISCLLSLRSRDETTERISEELFEVVDTPLGILGLDLELLEKIIFSTGHYHKKALVLKSVSKELIERFDTLLLT